MRRPIPLLFMPCAFAALPTPYSDCKVMTTSNTMVRGTRALINYPLTALYDGTTYRMHFNGYGASATPGTGGESNIRLGSLRVGMPESPANSGWTK
jgi:hypothetical protein